jgi:hypothetical protein
MTGDANSPPVARHFHATAPLARSIAYSAPVPSPA